MKYILGTILIVTLMVQLFAKDKKAEPSVIIEYFFQPGCTACEKIDGLIKPELEALFADQIKIVPYSTNVDQNFYKLIAYIEKFKIKGNKPVSMVVNGRHFLFGYDEIEEKLISTVEDEVMSGQSPPKDLLSEITAKPPREVSNEQQTLLKERAEKFTLFFVISGGFLDGINPCVFSTLIFFLSLLSVSKIQGKRLAIIGTTYCIACFVCYFALSFGLFKFIKELSSYHTLRGIIYWSMTGLLILLSALSFKDAIQFHKTKKADSVTLQLPASIKTIIHNIMKKGLAMSFLIPGALLIGTTVTLFESLCTGQVLAPVLTRMATVDDGKSYKYLLYLLIYNTMFIIPLIAVFVTFYYGVKVPKLVNWSKKNVVASKISLGIFFLLLAALMIVF